MATKSGIILDDGEQVVQEVEAEFYATSSNPLAKLFGIIAQFINLILGNKEKAFLVITNKRIFVTATSVRLYCITAGKNISYILPSSVQEIGYVKSSTCWFFCPAYDFYYKTTMRMLRFQVKEFDEKQMKKLVDDFYGTLAK